MGKRLLVIITLLLVTGIFTGWYFFAKESRYFGTSPLKAVPVDSPLFIRVRNIGEFAEKSANNICWQSLSTLPEVASMHGDIVFLDSLIHQNKKKLDLKDNKELYVVQLADYKLYLLEIGSITEKNSINALIRDYFAARKIGSTTEKYKEASLQRYSWEGKNGKKQIILTFHKGVLMASDDSSQLRKAIDQMELPSLLEDPDFAVVNKNTAVNTDLNIFVNRKAFSSKLTYLLVDSLLAKSLHPGYTKWTEVDVVQKDNKLMFNGFTVVDSALSTYQNIFKRQKPLAGSLSRWIPANTTFFVSQNLSHPRLYFEDYLRYLQKNQKLEDYNRLVSKVSKELHLDISQYLVDSWTGEAAVIFTNQNRIDRSDNRFLLIKVKSAANDALVAAVRKWNVSNNSKRDDETSDAARNNIWRVPFENFGTLAGDLFFGSVDTKWMTAGEGFILMGPTSGSLKRYLNLLGRSELLASHQPYAEFASGLANSYSFYLWSTPGHVFPFFETVIRPEIYQKLVSSAQGLKKVENLSWQWGYENGLVYNAASFNVNPNADQGQLPFWRYPLKAKIRNMPAFVSYSKKSSANELVFQDLDNDLIDLDSDGTVHWKIALEGAIIGEIKQVDSHNNGEFQLLFNTREAIHLINRNGVEGKNFPVKLKSPATNSVSVFDYDGKRDYRYLVACSDKKVYNFDKNGKINTGWKPKSTNGIVEFPLHHFRAGSKDYIVFFDKSRTYILDRQGKERVRLMDEFEHSTNDISLIHLTGQADCMCTTDKQGNVRLLKFDGSSKRFSLGKFTSGHYFLPVEFGGDGGPDFVIYDKKRLYRFDQLGKLIFSVDISIPVDRSPSKSYLGNERVILLNSEAENKSILVRRDGSFFDYFHAGNNQQVVGSFDGLYNVENRIEWSSDGFLSNYQMVIK